jgi:hypothetical protein
LQGDEVATSWRVIAGFSTGLVIETRSLPALARCYPCSFTFYVTFPKRSIPLLATCSISLIPSAPFASMRRGRQATDFTYRPEVYKRAWARDTRDNYGNMERF